MAMLVTCFLKTKSDDQIAPAASATAGEGANDVNELNVSLLFVAN
jgi:hypothetical protein